MTGNLTQQVGQAYFPEWCVRSYSHPVDSSADSYCFHRLVLTARLIPGCLVASSLQLTPINTHAHDVTYWQQELKPAMATNRKMYDSPLRLDSAHLF